MGLWDSTKALFSGRPGDAADYLFIDSETVAVSNETDRKLDELNRKQADAGKMTEQDYRERLARITNNAFPDFIAPTGERGRMFDQPGVSPAAGFWSGMKDGAANIRKTVSTAITESVGFSFSLVPWQVWVALGLYLAFITLPMWAPGFAGKLKLLKK